MSSYESVLVGRYEVERSYDVDSDNAVDRAARRQVRQHSRRQRLRGVVRQRVQPERALATRTQTPHRRFIYDQRLRGVVRQRVQPERALETRTQTPCRGFIYDAAAQKGRQATGTAGTCPSNTQTPCRGFIYDQRLKGVVRQRVQPERALATHTDTLSQTYNRERK